MLIMAVLDQKRLIIIIDMKIVLIQTRACQSKGQFWHRQELVPAVSDINSDVRPWLNVCVNGKSVNLLMDKGSAVTLLNSSIFCPESSHCCQLVGVGGNKLECKGYLNALISDDEFEKRWSCHVVDLPIDGILGADFFCGAGWFLANENGCKIGSNNDSETSLPRKILAVSEASSNLDKQLDDSVKNVPLDYRGRMLRLLHKFSHVFTRKKFVPGLAVDINHHIILEDLRPIRQSPYRVAPAKRNEIQTLVDEMLELGVIEPSCSPWSSPVVLVKKSDGTSRFCVDYRRLNSVTRKDNYSLPNPQDILTSLGDATWFCTLDLQSGYWQIPMS